MRTGGNGSQGISVPLSRPGWMNNKPAKRPRKMERGRECLGGGSGCMQTAVGRASADGWRVLLWPKSAPLIHRQRVRRREYGRIHTGREQLPRPPTAWKQLHKNADAVRVRLYLLWVSHPWLHGLHHPHIALLGDPSPAVIRPNGRCKNIISAV